MKSICCAVSVTLMLGCGGSDGANFDVSIILGGAGGYALYHGNSSQLRDEASRAQSATGSGPDGPIAMFANAFKTSIPNVQPVGSPDGHLVAVQRGTMIDLISPLDGNVKSTVDVGPPNNALLAIQDGGSHIAIMKGNGPFTLRIVDVASGTGVDAGTVQAPRATFAGSTLYLLEPAGAFQVGADGMRTPLTGLDTVTKIVGEPKGTRLWGLNRTATTTGIFYIDGGGAAATLATDPLEAVAALVEVGAGGHLIFQSGQKTYSTDGKGASPSEYVSNVLASLANQPLGLSPDGSAIVYSAFDPNNGGGVGYASSSGETAFVDAAGAAPSAILPYY